MRARLPHITVVAAILGVLAFAAVSQAQTDTEQVAPSWAKLNVCSPTQVGARAQLAGDGTQNGMYVRFSLQWLSDTGWVPLGELHVAVGLGGHGRPDLAAGRVHVQPEPAPG